MKYLVVFVVALTVPLKAGEAFAHKVAQSMKSAQSIQVEE